MGAAQQDSTGDRLAVMTTAQGHNGAVWRVPPSGGGRLLASSGNGGMVWLWDSESGACVRTLRSDRRDERLDITSLRGITEAQRVALLALSATEQTSSIASTARRPIS